MLDEKLKEIIENDVDYIFLEDNDFNKKIEFLVMGGSRAYGTDIEGSDIDLRGVFKEEYEDFMYMPVKKKVFRDKETDTTISPLVHFLELLRKNDANTLCLLGVEEEDILIPSELYFYLRNNIDKILVKGKVYAQFKGMGYGFWSQVLKRQGGASQEDVAKLLVGTARILSMGIEILNTGVVKTRRPKSEIEIYRGWRELEDIFIGNSSFLKAEAVDFIDELFELLLESFKESNINGAKEGNDDFIDNVLEKTRLSVLEERGV